MVIKSGNGKTESGDDHPEYSQWNLNFMAPTIVFGRLQITKLGGCDRYHLQISSKKAFVFKIWIKVNCFTLRIGQLRISNEWKLTFKGLYKNHR